MKAQMTLQAYLDESHGDEHIAEMDAEMQPSRELALMLVRLRQERQMTQREFAQLTQVSPAYISRLESGLANPSIRSLGSLLRRAGVQLELNAVPATGSQGRPGIARGVVPDCPQRPSCRTLHNDNQRAGDRRSLCDRQLAEG